MGSRIFSDCRITRYFRWCVRVSTHSVVCGVAPLPQLDCCRPVDEIKERGLDLDLFVCLARCNSATAELVRASEEVELPGVADPNHVAAHALPLVAAPGLDAFRRAVAASAKQGEGEFMVLSYSRKALGQTGDGHFSPLGGYNAAKDMVLIMDVARFKYPPHWVPLPLLWKAMQLRDAETALPRGYVVLRRLASAPLLLFHLPAATTSAGSAASSSLCAQPCLNKRLHASLESGLRACRDVLQAPPPPAAVDGPPPHSSAAPHVAAAVRIFVSTLEASTVTLADTIATPELLPSTAPAPPVLLQQLGHSADDCSGSGCDGAHDGPTLAPSPISIAPAAATATTAAATTIYAAAGGSVGAAASAAASAVPVIDFEEARCVDKLSREHIGAAAALIADLEGTPLYPLVVAALRAHYGMPPLAGTLGTAAAAAERDMVDSATILLTSTEAEPGPHSPARLLSPTAAVSCGTSPVGAAPLPPLPVPAAAGVSVGGAAPALVPCDSHGLSCIRVRKSHVLTMLLIAFALRPPPMGTALRPRPASAAVAALVEAVEQSVEGGSALLRHEANVIREQLRSAECSLIE